MTMTTNETTNGAFMYVCSDPYLDEAEIERDERKHYKAMLDDPLVIWRPWEVDRAKELGLVDEKEAASLAVYDDSADVAALVASYDEKGALKEKLDDELAIWTKSEVKRALELGLIDAEKADALGGVEDSELFLGM